MPSQQCSVSGRRTALIPQSAMARVARLPVGPAKNPWPPTQAYSPPERLTPSRRTGSPEPSTSRLSSTHRQERVGATGAGDYDAEREHREPGPEGSRAATAPLARRPAGGDRADLDPSRSAAELDHLAGVLERPGRRRRTVGRDAYRLGRDDVVEVPPSPREAPLDGRVVIERPVRDD